MVKDPDTLCPDSPTRYHYMLMTTVISRTPAGAKCQFCGLPLKISGALWALDRHVIREAPEITD